MKPAVMALGGETLFSGVTIKPGQASDARAHRERRTGLDCLAIRFQAFVTFQVFGTALIRSLTGEATGTPTRRHVVTATEIRRKPGRCELRPATLAGFDPHGREIAHFEDATHSARVGLLPLADGLMFLPADADNLSAGALVEFQPFCQS